MACLLMLLVWLIEALFQLAARLRRGLRQSRLGRFSEALAHDSSLAAAEALNGNPRRIDQ